MQQDWGSRPPVQGQSTQARRFGTAPHTIARPVDEPRRCASTQREPDVLLATAYGSSEELPTGLPSFPPPPHVRRVLQPWRHTLPPVWYMLPPVCTHYVQLGNLCDARGKCCCLFGKCCLKSGARNLMFGKHCRLFGKRLRLFGKCCFLFGKRCLTADADHLPHHDLLLP